MLDLAPPQNQSYFLSQIHQFHLQITFFLWLLCQDRSFTKKVIRNHVCKLSFYFSVEGCLRVFLYDKMSVDMLERKSS